MSAILLHSAAHRWQLSAHRWQCSEATIPQASAQAWQISAHRLRNGSAKFDLLFIRFIAKTHAPMQSRAILTQSGSRITSYSSRQISVNRSHSIRVSRQASTHTCQFWVFIGSYSLHYIVAQLSTVLLYQCPHKARHMLDWKSECSILSPRCDI